MIGLECERPVKDVIEKGIKNGVLCLSAKAKLRLLPALNIPFDLLEKDISVIKDALI